MILTPQMIRDVIARHTARSFVQTKKIVSLSQEDWTNLVKDYYVEKGFKGSPSDSDLAYALKTLEEREDVIRQGDLIQLNAVKNKQLLDEMMD